MSKIFVGMSGGVDSAVSAAILLRDGHDVTGVFMKNWSGDDLGIDDQCPWQEDMDYAQKACEKLNIPFISYNFEKEYRESVISNFYEEYERGNTPNPDILCNSFIKFDVFMKRAIEDGADLIATGHYARTEDGSLFKATDRSKDQTYFLSGLTEEQLSKAYFPLHSMKKSEVRKLAAELGLPNATRKDSQGICFVGKVDIQDFLSLRLKEIYGEIVDVDTDEVVGEHNGVWFYTNGQRKGLQIGGLEQPYFVACKDVENNRLYVANGKKHPQLWSNTISTEPFQFINQDEKLEGELTAQIRYRSEPTAVKFQDGKFVFKKPLWAPSKGQSLVVYRGEKCLGRGIITEWEPAVTL
ncbi:MAG: tRNA 2-thiouridine(34) synthase MnmA [Candidatus Dojkabacteria bacterium]|nr:MAG: tRNA 2-thiouridine(34) synthase MnmA [Candidatus Dojkabacteria bacterium]